MMEERVREEWIVDDGVEYGAVGETGMAYWYGLRRKSLRSLRLRRDLAEVVERVSVMARTMVSFMVAVTGSFEC